MKRKELVRAISIFNREHRSQIQKIMESEGLFYGQLPILETVKNLGSCTQKEIATQLHVSAPSVATSVKRLVKKGYLTKKTDENDQRNSRVEITESGRMKSDACREKFDKLDARVFRDLSDEECDMLAHILDKLNSAVGKENAND